MDEFGDIRFEKEPDILWDVKLIDGKGDNKQRKLCVGKELGRGESGVVRKVKVNEEPMAIKIYTDQDGELIRGENYNHILTRPRNLAYEEQLIYYESLRRLGASVIPLFCLAENNDGNILGIVMMDLTLNALDQKAGYLRVTSAHEDRLGSILSGVSRGRDVKLASSIGLSLDTDTWMLQYKNIKKGIQNLSPRAFISDLIGVKITAPKVYKTFLGSKENEDLFLQMENNSGLRIKLS